MGVISKSGFSAEGTACVSEGLQNVFVGDAADLSVDGDSVDGGGTRGTRDHTEYPLDLGPVSEDRAKDRIAGSSLRSRVHFDSVLLVNESNGNKLRIEKEERVRMTDLNLADSPENESVEVDTLCLSGDRSFRVLARPSSKEEPSSDNVGYYRGSGIEKFSMLGGFDQLPE